MSPSEQRVQAFCREELAAGRTPTVRRIADYMGWQDKSDIGGRYVKIRTAAFEEAGYTKDSNNRWVKA